MWNKSPVQVQCMRQGAQGWCTGMTLRDEMGKEVGGRVRMGNTCTPMADSCECMAKPSQYWKKRKENYRPISLITVHIKKDQTPWSTGINLRDTRVLLHVHINQHCTHQWIEEEKSYDHLNRCRKIFGQNSTFMIKILKKKLAHRAHTST